MAPSNCTQKAVNSNYETRSKDTDKFSWKANNTAGWLKGSSIP